MRSANGLVATACAWTAPAKEYALEGSVFVAGAVVQWLRDGSDSSVVLGESRRWPHSVPRLRRRLHRARPSPAWARRTGTPTRAARSSASPAARRRAHIARAALESIAYQSAEVLEAMQKDAGRARSPELRVDGGAAANDLLMQFQADLLGVPVVRPQVLETTALGAAYLAGLTVNLWRSRDEIAAHWQARAPFRAADGPGDRAPAPRPLERGGAALPALGVKSP